MNILFSFLTAMLSLNSCVYRRLRTKQTKFDYLMMMMMVAIYVHISTKHSHTKQQRRVEALSIDRKIENHQREIETRKNGLFIQRPMVATASIAIESNENKKNHRSMGSNFVKMKYVSNRLCATRLRRRRHPRQVFNVKAFDLPHIAVEISM